MSTLSVDTSPEAEAVVIEGMRAMPVWRKLRRVKELNQFLQGLALANIRRRHPEADERELSLRLASLWLPSETMKTVWGWDPDREGF
jgi:hypothetical protein